MCGRSQLSRVLYDLKANFAFEMRLGIEFDFKLLKHAPHRVQHGLQETTRMALDAIESNLHANNSNSLMLIEEEMIDITNMLNICGIQVESISKKNLEGQFRMSLGKYEDAMKATENY